MFVNKMHSVSTLARIRDKMNLFLYNASTVLCFCTAVGLGSASSQAGVRDVPLLKRRDVSVNRQLLSKVSITRTRTPPDPQVYLREV